MSIFFISIIGILNLFILVIIFLGIKALLKKGFRNFMTNKSRLIIIVLYVIFLAVFVSGMYFLSTKNDIVKDMHIQNDNQKLMDEFNKNIMKFINEARIEQIENKFILGKDSFLLDKNLINISSGNSNDDIYVEFKSKNDRVIEWYSFCSPIYFNEINFTKKLYKTSYKLNTGLMQFM